MFSCLFKKFARLPSASAHIENKTRRSRSKSLSLTLPPTFIQRERDSGFEFCLLGRFGQRGLARSFAGCAASVPVAR